MVTVFNCFSFNDEWFLVEMVLSIPPTEIRLDQIVVPEEGIPKEDWQAVYLEQFLNADGTARICDLYETPDHADSHSRIAFFIYKTAARTLETPYGQFQLSDGAEIPDRLKSIIEFDEDDL